VRLPQIPSHIHNFDSLGLAVKHWRFDWELDKSVIGWRDILMKSHLYWYAGSPSRRGTRQIYCQFTAKYAEMVIKK
jgi:hypothetical protein